MEDKTKNVLNNDFINYFGMTIDDFDRLDSDTKEILVRKVIKMRKKLLYIGFKDILNTVVTLFRNPEEKSQKM